MENNELLNVAGIRFSSRGRVYYYLSDIEVNIGDDVSISGKKDLFKVVEAKKLKKEELPVPLEEMKKCEVVNNQELDLLAILANNPILNIANNNSFLIGRDNVIEELLINLNKKRMKNTILIGDAGCGKTTIVESLAYILADRCYTLTFCVGDLIGGTTLRGQLEEKISNVFNDIKRYNSKYDKKIILFVDEIHMIYSNCGCSDGISIHNLLKTYLTDPNMILIGATTVNEFNNSIKLDNALMRRMTPLYVKNLSDNDVLDILREFSDNLISDELLEYVIDESKSIPNTTNPDISIEIVDRALAKSNLLDEKIDLAMLNNIISRIKDSYSI